MTQALDMEYSSGLSPRTAFLKWTAIGTVVAAVLLIGQAAEVGGIAGLLQVAEGGHLQEVITSELGELPLADAGGHDTSLFYGIGLDPSGEFVPELIDHAAYRYRRILYPATASLFGLLDGHALLMGMIVVTVLSAGIAAGSTAAIAVRCGRSDWLALIILLNPGVWLAVRLLTAETMALAAMVGALFMLASDRRGAAYLFALSGLAKETFLVTPLGIAASSPRQRWRLALIPLAAVGVWVLWISLRIGNGLMEGGNIGLPFAGMIEAIPVWLSSEAEDVFYLTFALLSVFGGLLYAIVSASWLRWPILGWSILGLVSSHFVWDLGNNAARVFAPIAVLVGLSMAARGSPLAETAMPVGASTRD